MLLLGVCMFVVYVVLVASIAFAHLLIYWLIKAGIEDSKKPAPLSARQRRSGRMPSITATSDSTYRLKCIE